MLADIVRQFRDLKVLVIGDAMLDTYLEGAAHRICAEGPVPVVQKTGEERFPGGAANTAANVVAMGACAVLLSIVGNDHPGHVLTRSLSEAGVCGEHIVQDGEASTIHKLRILAGSQYVVRFDEGDGKQWSAQAKSEALRALETAYADCDLVVVSDYGYGTLSDLMLHRLKALRARRPVPLFVDSKDIRRFRSAGANVVTPNQLEAFVAVERSLPHNQRLDIDEIDSIGRRLLTLLDAGCVAVTLAGDGVYLLERSGQTIHIPAHPVTAAHDIGAGDSFLAAMALALTASRDLENSARIAVEAGRIAVSKRRTSVVQHHELLQSISLATRPAPASMEALVEQLDRDRAAGRVIVFTNGVFDIVHAGHVDYLRQAKSLGDVLVVGVNTDASARRLKGRNRPINNERDRLALVSALDSVDHAILFEEDEPSSLIRLLRPAIHVKGGDYAGEYLPEAQAVSEIGGRVEILPLAGHASTSSIIGRIVELELQERRLPVEAQA